MATNTAQVEVVGEDEIAEIEESSASAALSLATQVAAISIQSADDANGAAALRASIVDRRKGVEEWFRAPVTAAHKAHKALTQRRAEALAPFAAPEKELTRKLATWQMAEERRVREAEMERQRLIEQERRRQEAAAADAREAERKRLEDEQLARAAEAEQAGDDALAERIADLPVAAPPVPVAPAPVPVAPAPVPAAAKVEGVSFVTKYRHEVIDMQMLITAAAARPHLAKLLKADDVALRKMASALGMGMDVPGVRVVEDRTVRSA